MIENVSNKLTEHAEYIGVGKVLNSKTVLKYSDLDQLVNMVLEEFCWSQGLRFHNWNAAQTHRMGN